MKRFLTIVALALVLGLTADSAFAAKGNKAAGKGKKADKPIAGTVVKVDGTNIIVQTKGKNAAEVTVTTDASTDIQINGAKGALADIKPGARIQATPNTGTATKVVVGGEGKGKAGKAGKGKGKNAAAN